MCCSQIQPREEVGSSKRSEDSEDDPQNVLDPLGFWQYDEIDEVHKAPMFRMTEPTPALLCSLMQVWMPARVRWVVERVPPARR